MLLYVTASSGKNLELAQELSQIGKEFVKDNTIVNLVEFNLPLYSTEQEQEGIPENLRDLLALFQSAQAILYIAPEYNGGIPPVLSNSIAWLSRSGSEDWRTVFNGKIAALATHSGGSGSKVLAAMRSQLEHLGTTVIARQLQTNFGKPLNPDSGKAVIEQLLKLSGK